MADGTLLSCPCCGLVQTSPAVTPAYRACCCRCATTLPRRAHDRALGRTAALASAALILYPLAVFLPVMQVQRFGHHHDASIIDGVAGLLTSGHVALGLVVLLC